MEAEKIEAEMARLWDEYLHLCSDFGPLTEEWPDNRVRALSALVHSEVSRAVAAEREGIARQVAASLSLNVYGGYKWTHELIASIRSRAKEDADA